MTNVRLKVAIDKLPETEVKLFLVGFVEDDDRLLKADLLLHDEVILVEKERTQPVWVEIIIPENTCPGLYKGEVQIYMHSILRVKSL